MNMQKIKIGYFGDGVWAHEAFKMLAADSQVDIAFVCVRFDSEDTRLRELAEKEGIEVLKEKDVNNPEFVESMKKRGCDLFVSMSFNQIFKKEMIEMPRLKTIKCHAGKLPFYRGRNVLNWALINGENEFGITIHYIDEGIDTGDILLQRTYRIEDNDTYATLLKKAHIECAALLYEAICMIKDGTVKRIKQSDIDPTGSYCRRRKDGDEFIDWNKSSREITDFIRAICSPGPMARSLINGKIVKINAAALTIGKDLSESVPGQVLSVEHDRAIIRTKDSAVSLTEYEIEGGLKTGDRLC